MSYFCRSENGVGDRTSLNTLVVDLGVSSCTACSQVNPCVGNVDLGVVCTAERFEPWRFDFKSSARVINATRSRHASHKVALALVFQRGSQRIRCSAQVAEATGGMLYNNYSPVSLCSGPLIPPSPRPRCGCHGTSHGLLPGSPRHSSMFSPQDRDS